MLTDFNFLEHATRTGPVMSMTDGQQLVLHSCPEGRGGDLLELEEKQPTAAISSSEADYQAMAAAVQEILYLRSLLEEMGVKSE